ncbi:amidohydrolase family protein [Gordonia sp. DT219]|uniref:amidohydrolase family protein n=1 Tax=Gordonia sp. DT219 TaxID=3416658 RepID=UPI003CF81C3B
MSAPTQSIDTLITHADVITFDDEGSLFDDGAIAIDNGSIVEIGPTAALTAKFSAIETVDAAGMIAMPGLIDAHLHTAQTMMRGLFPEIIHHGNLEQPMWRKYLIPFESNLTDDDMELSGRLAYSSLLLTGTTTFFDAGGPHPDAAARAAVDTGIRGIITRSTVDDSFDIPESMRLTTDQAIEENIGLVERWPAGGRVTGAMALRQIMNCSPELITAIHREATARGVKVHTHLLEGSDEIAFSVVRYGKRPVEFLTELEVFDSTLHCAHSVFASPWDVAAYARSGASVAHCANNYMFGVPRALEYWRSGVAIGLGTDGAATSPGTLDMFRITEAVGRGQQHIYGVPVHEHFLLEPDEPLRMATRGGARALNMSEKIGRLEAGLAADIVLLRTDGPDGVAVSPLAFLVDGATGRDVDTVFVDGRRVVEGGELTTIDVAETRARGVARQKDLVAAFQNV